MGEFIRKFMQLNGRMATVTLKHYLFGTQCFRTQALNFIDDHERLGLVLKGQDVFVYKERLCEIELNNNTVIFADDKLKIAIKLVDN